MKKIAIFLFIIFNLTAIFAQEVQNSSFEWKTLAPAEEEFSIDMPPNLIAETDSKEGDRRYEAIFYKTYFYIFSDPVKNPYQSKQVVEFAKFNNKRPITKKIGSENVESYEFADEEEFHHQILIFKTSMRIYAFHSVSFTKDNPQTARFFSSLKIRPLSAEISEKDSADSLKIKDKKSKNQDKTPSDGTSSNTIKTDGRGQGAGSEYIERLRRETPSTTNSSQTNPTPQTNSRGVKISAKPKPRYTDFARFYNIEGTVELKVTFLFDGRIGAVSPINKLPFGLTKQAIEAARLIEFDPAVRDGVPYSVIKQVNYSFSIF